MANDGQRPRHGDVAWAELYEELTSVPARPPLDLDDLERLGVAAFFVGDDERSLQAWEQAYDVAVRAGDADRAARCSFWLGIGLLLSGQEARANGWFASGRRILVHAPADCAGHGYLLVPAAMEALGSGDAPGAFSLYDEVGAIAEHCHDPDLVALSLLGRGESKLAAGESKAGLALLDEAMVTATSSDVSAITTGILYCAVIDACVQALDIRRATQWTNALSEWCARQPGMVAFRGQCLVHRSQVLQAQGAWDEAMAEAADAQQRLRQPPHPAIGVAFYQQGELLRLRGDFEAAERAYRSATEHGRPPTPGIALLRLAESRVDEAAAAIRRMADEAESDLDRVAVLPAFVEIMLAVGDVEAARRGSAQLVSIAPRQDSPYVQALADQACAASLLADGASRDALPAARKACRTWRALHMPYETARCQLLIAAACEAVGDRDAADFERHAATATLDRLGAAHPGEGTRSAAAPRGDQLTEREREVLRLLAGGETNRSIGRALHISEHTVARHVQNIFTKLGVSSRAAATAHAYGHHLI